MKYVSVICLDRDSKEVVVLKKLSGPASVVGKIVFPGGKVEERELPVAAAKRELLEEAGVDVEVEDLVAIATFHVTNENTLYVFAVDYGAAEARPQEDEAEKVYTILAEDYFWLDNTKSDLKLCLGIALKRFNILQDE